VYWSPSATSLLANLNPSESLTVQLAADGFSLPNAPIWQDFSTAKECRVMEAAVGGPQALSDLTGSRAYERFTGSQILKVCMRLDL
jgi:xylulokinase